MERIGDWELDLEELTHGLLFIPSCPGVTGLTGASHLWDFPRVNVLVCSLLLCVATGQFFAGFEEFA
jgi:hypothetical protein